VQMQEWIRGTDVGKDEIETNGNAVHLPGVNQIGVEGAKFISNSLKSNSTLTQLQLFSMFITVCISLSKAQKSFILDLSRK